MLIKTRNKIKINKSSERIEVKLRMIKKYKNEFRLIAIYIERDNNYWI